MRAFAFDPATDPLRDTHSYGSRYASRVRVKTPQGSSYDGRTGIIARIVNGAAIVRFPDGTELPFARTELEALS